MEAIHERGEMTLEGVRWAGERTGTVDGFVRVRVDVDVFVRVTVRAIFPNCPRYIPKMQLVEPSVYAPQPGSEPVEPAWKGFDIFKGYVHPRQPTAR